MKYSCAKEYSSRKFTITQNFVLTSEKPANNSRRDDGHRSSNFALARCACSRRQEAEGGAPLWAWTRINKATRDARVLDIPSGRRPPGVFRGLIPRDRSEIIMTTSEIEPPVYDADYHKKIELEEGPMAVRLSQWILRRWALGQSPAIKLTDFGSSTGLYVRATRALGIESIGIDDSPAAIEGRLSEHVHQGDITAHCDHRWFCDVGLCIEVAEHVPGGKSDDLIRCLVRHTKRWLIFSAATVGQGGLGHVNCQPKEYWIEKFEKRGWIVDLMETVALLNDVRSGPHMGWFANNAMVLRPMRRG